MNKILLFSLILLVLLFICLLVYLNTDTTKIIQVKDITIEINCPIAYSFDKDISQQSNMSNLLAEYRLGTSSCLYSVHICIFENFKYQPDIYIKKLSKRFSKTVSYSYNSSKTEIYARMIDDRDGSKSDVFFRIIKLKDLTIIINTSNGHLSNSIEYNDKINIIKNMKIISDKKNGL